jgi:hypothetical protein
MSVHQSLCEGSEAGGDGIELDLLDRAALAAVEIVGPEHSEGNRLRMNIELICTYQRNKPLFKKSCLT